MVEVELRRRLERRTGKPVALTVTDNRSSMLHVTPGSMGRVKVRLHHMFLDAPPEVVQALAQYIRRPTQACHRELNSFIRANSHRIGGRPRHKVSINLSHRGFHFDLREVYERLNTRYFDGRLRVAITWGQSNQRRRRYSIDFGSYDQAKRIIRVNPSLDRPFVPKFFVEYIVYHEMLHAAIGFREAPNGRRALHSPRFREEERQYHFYRSALRWESANLWRFLRAG
ncbi:MAG TPA: SprT-like domain-containing protein [Candidatus Polarisedimenticolia bacterium]|nr:SprT-like domain-containing protein [Candidatus Polarisedimenticolia bacterium]